MSDASATVPVNRPTGAWHRWMGLSAIGIGVVMLGIGAQLPDLLIDGPAAISSLLPDPMPVANANKWRLMFGGGGLFSLGLFLWRIGQMQKSLYFLAAGDAVLQREMRL